MIVNVTWFFKFSVYLEATWLRNGHVFYCECEVGPLIVNHPSFACSRDG